MSRLRYLCRSITFAMRFRANLVDQLTLMPRRNLASTSEPQTADLRPQTLFEFMHPEEQSSASVPLSQNVGRLAFLMFIREHYGYERLYGRTIPMTKLVLEDRWNGLSEVK